MFVKRLTAFAAAVVLSLSCGYGYSQSEVDCGIYTYADSVYSAVVKLNAQGGSCSESAVTVYYGEKYGTLPTPTRSGYTFAGWYNDSGVKITANTVCHTKTAHTLYAHWTKNPKTCTLSFDANGGKITTTTSSKKYTQGKIIGAMPVAKKSGYFFKGWYTKKSGGTKVFYTTVLKSVKNRTFYAQYTRASQSNLKYSFSNSYEDFGYSYGYKIPKARYVYMFGKKYGTAIYNQVKNESWGGNCFGMSSTAAFFNTGKMRVQGFNRSINLIRNLKLTDTSAALGLTLQEFIECMQVAQYSTRIDVNENMYDFSGLVKAVKKCQSSSGTPIVVGIMSENSGHAVLAYKWKSVSTTKERLYIYDCNYPNDTGAYITLYKRNGKYIAFSFEGCAGYWDYSDYDYLTWFTFSDIWSVWSHRGTASAILSDTTDTLIASSAENAEIYDENGELCAVIKDGILQTDSDDITQSGGFSFSGTSTYIICLPEGEYTINS